MIHAEASSRMQHHQRMLIPTIYYSNPNPYIRQLTQLDRTITPEHMKFKQYFKFLSATLLLASFSVLASPQSFSQAKNELKKYVYFDQALSNQEFYCGCNWEWVGKSGGRIDHASCGYQVRAQQTRADRVEWEHVMPAHSFGQQRQCWQNGGRKNCVANDPVFREMEADMHNLVPAVGEVNADRSNFRFGVLPGTPHQHGACNVKIDFKQRVTEPRDEIKGMIARTYFYMHDRYNLRMSDQQTRLMQAWDKQFPVSQWEIERDRRIAVRMGHGNLFVSGKAME